MEGESSNEQKKLWQTAMARAHFQGLVRDSSQIGYILPLVLAAKVVVSDHSSVLEEGAINLKAVISVLYPKLFRELLVDFVGKLSDLPVNTLGCSARATNREELQSFMRLALSPSCVLENILKPNQERIFNLDGKNSARVADVVEELL